MMLPYFELFYSELLVGKKAARVKTGATGIGPDAKLGDTPKELSTLRVPRVFTIKF